MTDHDLRHGPSIIWLDLDNYLMENRSCFNLDFSYCDRNDNSFFQMLYFGMNLRKQDALSKSCLSFIML